MRGESGAYSGSCCGNSGRALLGGLMRVKTKGTDGRRQTQRRRMATKSRATLGIVTRKSSKFRGEKRGQEDELHLEFEKVQIISGQQVTVVQYERRMRGMAGLDTTIQQAGKTKKARPVSRSQAVHLLSESVGFLSSLSTWKSSGRR